ncbi:hypothetical protein Tco_0938665 [Tanacetum coccineum]|uniref:Transposase n=1 Tax=Tanacetum coccineum TaxID=301880 RepID=A0ABQ5DII2_9ASTR
MLTETYTNYFSIKFPYAGRFTDSPNKHYVDGEFACVDMVNNAKFRIDLLNSVLCSLGFEDDDVINLYYNIPLKSLDTGLRPLVSENDTSSFLGYVHKHKMMYAELVETIETSSDEDGEGDSEHDSEFGHFDANDIIDEEHLVDEVEVNMKDDLEVLDYDLLESDQEDVPAKMLGDLENERIRAYSVETRRNINFKRNDKRRIRAVCKGVVPSITGKNVFVDKDAGPKKDISRKGHSRTNAEKVPCCCFKECGRELLGLDEAFMRGQYPRKILTAVGVDANNGIYQ